jgi:hypothetical protein
VSTQTQSKRRSVLYSDWSLPLVTGKRPVRPKVHSCETHCTFACVQAELRLVHSLELTLPHLLHAAVHASHRTEKQKSTDDVGHIIVYQTLHRRQNSTCKTVTAKWAARKRESVRATSTQTTSVRGGARARDMRGGETDKRGGGGEMLQVFIIKPQA